MSDRAEENRILKKRFGDFVESNFLSDSWVTATDDIYLFLGWANMDKELESLQQQNKIMKEALGFYADKDCWKKCGLSTPEVSVKLNFIEHSVDTEWFPESSEQIGGGKARQALKQIEELKAGK